MKAQVLTIDGKEKGSIDLNDAIFAAKWNEDLVHQAFVTFTANIRRPWAHVKDRSEVRGGGKKPWRQKGTGRARHGSSRSPIWIGGGVTHGPSKDRDYSKKINKKMKRAALHAVLSKKLAEGEIKFIDSLNIESGKTKDLSQSLEKLLQGKKITSTLLISTNDNKTLYKAASNLEKIDSTKVTAMNIYELLTHRNVLIDAKAVEEIK
ncbi:MAG: 50S ribosomal protein L4 [Candidatus Harrisonbacteria bacterium CG10_big_fil_rev_8_21_14_0_10_44_23]|uniref:Large ribosomal subunit protein uL4 n=1 Tax=Candidatus Harrisonbacteria bacterium CG10_big_fil_rev_8_21_14_0_10_44_23 TaxID=1974585 RepID=A0A2H0UST2_9BACT|nr:MAG: 50S ribosomal protein L4 [Candidatus Harrisonbacteria bacterium CG10_big_fil_rev_8_21_14_0_10_44_23]